MTRLLALLLLAAAFVANPSPTAAVCDHLIGDPLFDPVAPNQTVFVGTAVDVGDNWQNALMHVREVWYGDPVSEWAPVFSEVGGHAMWGESPSFEEGVTYLVVVHKRDGWLITQGCGATRDYGETARAARPGDVMRPTPAKRPLIWDPTDGSMDAWLLPAFLLGALLILVAATMRQTRLQRGGRGAEADFNGRIG